MDINEYFQKLDEWRHLPSYKLENRVDALIGLFLPYVLNKTFNESISWVLPEFPLRKGLIEDSTPELNQSYRIDFVAITSNRFYLIELKTDQASYKEQQNKYLTATQKNLTSEKLLLSLKALYKASKEKNKYIWLHDALKDKGILADNSEIKDKSNIIVNSAYNNLSFEVVYIIPSGAKDNIKNSTIITLAEFANIIEKLNPLSQRLSKSLIEWDKAIAGKM